MSNKACQTFIARWIGSCGIAGLILASLSTALAQTPEATPAPAPAANAEPPPAPPGQVGVNAATIAPAQGLIEDVVRRQNELTILQLELQRAELEKKLRETQAPPQSSVEPSPINEVMPAQPAMLPPEFSPAAMLPAPDLSMPPAAMNPIAPPIERDYTPYVLLITRQDNQMVAYLSVNGGSVFAKAGTELADGWKVVEIRPDEVIGERTVGRTKRRRTLSALPIQPAIGPAATSMP